MTSSQLSRKGGWIQTFTGRQFWPLDPRPEDVDIKDIAHALSMTCRYGGHCKVFYSVAEHSLHVSDAVEEAGGDTAEQFLALLHDAAEAYLCDVPSPVKPNLPGFYAIESKVEAAIAESLGLPSLDKTPLIDEMDTRILVDECEVVMGVNSLDWARQHGPKVGLRICAWTPRDAEDLFMSRFWSLRGA